MGNEVNRIYTNDSCLWLNMTRDDVLKECDYNENRFNEADLNSDNMISRKKFDSYNRNISVYLWDKECLEKGLNAKTVYPEMVREEAYKDKTTKNMFDRLNTDNDDKLSYDEVNAYALGVIRQRDLSKYNYSKNQNQQAKVNKMIGGGALIGGILGVLAGNAVLGKTLTTVACIAPKSPFGIILGALAFGGAIVGGYLGEKAGKIIFNDNKDWSKEFNKEYKASKQAPTGSYPFEVGVAEDAKNRLTK